MTLDTIESPPSAMEAVFTPQSVEIVIDRRLKAYGVTPAGTWIFEKRELYRDPKTGLLCERTL